MKEIITSPQFWAIIVPALIGVLTFYKTKEAERESEWRKEKLKLYLKFVEALSGITDAEITDDGVINFAKACNDLHALSSLKVICALHEYQHTPNSSAELKQKALDKLLYEIRRDLKIKPRDKEKQFQMLLWTSGKKKNMQ